MMSLILHFPSAYGVVSWVSLSDLISSIVNFALCLSWSNTLVCLSTFSVAGGSSEKAKEGLSADSTVTGTTGTMNPNGTINQSADTGTVKTDPTKNPNGDIVIKPVDPNHPKTKKPKTNPSDGKNSTHDNLGMEKDDTHENK